MPTAFIYTRVSSKDQADSGLGLRSQVKAAKALVEHLAESEKNVVLSDVVPHDPHRHWLTSAGVFVDAGVSAYKYDFLSRPVGSQLLRHMKSGDILIVAKFDRCFRANRDMNNTMPILKGKGIRVIFADNPHMNSLTASGKAQLNMHGTFAQWHSDLASERLKETHDMRGASTILARPIRKVSAAAWSAKGLYKCCRQRKDFVILRWYLHRALRGDKHAAIARDLMAIKQRRWGIESDPSREEDRVRAQLWLSALVHRDGEKVCYRAKYYGWFKGAPLVNTSERLEHWSSMHIKKRRARKSRAPRIDDFGELIPPEGYPIS